MQHTIDYIPGGGLAVTGWPTLTIARGQVMMQDRSFVAEPGPTASRRKMRAPRGRTPNEFDAAAFGKAT
jgi:dihydropyrimidinase